MYLLSIKFIAAFPDANLQVEIVSPSGSGNQYQLMVANKYLGILANTKDGWMVQFQNPTDEFSMGDLQPLIDLVT